ncbi:hypothetical protein [Aquicoccus sp.]|uniref:hypothetical protein n=1 Tax=Aquicoccus sp. TaxID=2055851 RepID=UPI00356351BA
MFNMTPSELQEFLHERALTSDEVIKATGVDKFAFRNWIKRGTLEIGHKHRLGRLAFSPADAMRVSAMVDLVSKIGISPLAAAKLAEQPVRLVETFIQAEEKHRSSDEYDGFSALPVPIDRFVSVALVQNEEVLTFNAYWDEDRLFFSGEDAGRVEGTHPMLSLSHVVLGSGLIVDDIMEKVRALMDEVVE